MIKVDGYRAMLQNVHESTESNFSVILFLMDFRFFFILMVVWFEWLLSLNKMCTILKLVAQVSAIKILTHHMKQNLDNYE